MAEHYRQWHQSCRELAQHQQQSQERAARAELLAYQLKELNEFNPQPGEFEQIDEEYKRLANSGHLLSTSQNALNLLADGEDVNLQSQLYNVRQLNYRTGRHGQQAFRRPGYAGRSGDSDLRSQ